MSTRRPAGPRASSGPDAAAPAAAVAGVPRDEVGAVRDVLRQPPGERLAHAERDCVDEGALPEDEVVGRRRPELGEVVEEVAPA
jgi:hypothetical protein